MLLTVQCCWILHASDGIRGCYSQTKHEMPHMEMHSKVWPNIPEDVIQHGSLWAVFFHIERDRWCYLCFLISPFSLSLLWRSKLLWCRWAAWPVNISLSSEMLKKHEFWGIKTLKISPFICIHQVVKYFLLSSWNASWTYRVRKIHVVKAYTSTSNLVTN